MPSPERRLRARARAFPRAAIDQFVTLLNQGTRDDLPAFDPARCDAHQRLLEDVRSLTATLFRIFKKHGAGPFEPDTFLTQHVSQEPVDGETSGAAVARVMVALECRSLLTLFFHDPDWQGFYCLERCRTCEHWFFTTDDRQWYCTRSCQPSRQPGARTERSSGARRRAR